MRNGRSVHGNFLKVRLRANNHSETRFAFIVGARTAKKATERNKIKRHLRAVIAQQMNNLQRGFDCVVLTGPEIKGKSFQEVEVELVALLKKSGFL